MQKSNGSVIATIIICSVILFIGGMFAVSQIPEVPEIVIPTAAEVAAEVAGLIVIPSAPEVDTSAIDRLGSLTEGYDGQWDLNNFMQGLSVVVVMEELMDRDSRILFNEIEELVDVEEREDIVDANVYDVRGEMTVNQEDYDSLYDANDDTVVTVEFVIEVEYFDDDDNEVRFKWFKVTATIEDVEDGIAEGDVTIVSVEKVSKHFEFD